MPLADGNAVLESLLDKKAPYKIIQGLVLIFLFAIAVIYPFFYKGNVISQISEDKWSFLTGLTLWFRPAFLPEGVFLPGVFLLSALSFAWLVRALRKDGDLFSRYFSLKNLSATDICVLAFAAASVLSSLFSPYKDQVLWGELGFNMGLVAQLIFVAAYFLVSRFFSFDDVFFNMLLASSAGVFLIALLNRFGQDPFAMYDGILPAQKPFFLSTIGQTTWYSSFVCTVCPLGVFAFWHAARKRARLLAGLYTALSAATVVTANADSAFAGLAAMLGVLLFASMDSAGKMARFIEVLVVILASWRAVGLAARFAPSIAAPLDAIGASLSGDAWGWVALFLCIPLLIYFRRRDLRPAGAMENRGVPEWAQKAFPLAVLAAVAVLSAYIALNTLGKLPEGLSVRNNYLFFDKDWGHFRGAIWMDTFASIAMALKDAPWQLAIGAGPGCFFMFTYSRAASNIKSIAYAAAGYQSEKSVVGNAHNEWLNMLVCEGIIGLVSYAGIFLTSAWRMVRARKECPECLAVALCIASYMAHNFFCYQQCICTIYIFIFMGCGESLLKKGIPDDVRNYFSMLSKKERENDKARAGKRARR